MAVPAPHDVTNESLSAARARFDAFRLQIWQSTSEQRGHPLRVKAMGLAPVGTRRFALLSRVGSSMLRTARKVGFGRRSLVVVPQSAFPKGFDPNATLGSDSNSITVVHLAAPQDPSSWTAVNEALVGLDYVIVTLPGTELRPGAARAFAETLTASQAAIVTGDVLTQSLGAGAVAEFRPERLGLVSLLSYDAVGTVAGFDAKALQAIGGFSSSLGELGLLDAAFRLVEAGNKTAHARGVLASTVARELSFFHAHAAWTRGQLERLGFTATATPTESGAISWRAVPASWPTVTVVIPTRDRLDLLQRCLAGVERSSYPHFSVVLCDNDSVEPATKAFFAETAHQVVSAPGPFNYSAIVNRGVAASQSDYIVTLNNDVEIHDVDWLERLVSVAQLPHVGPVGCALKEPTGAFNHEGIAIAPYPQHLRRDLNYTRVDAFLTSTREVAAVTGACTVVKRSLWEQLHGLDSTLAVIGNDVDFCLRASVAGFNSVYVADLHLEHAESSSRGALNPPEDIYRLVARWGLFQDFVDPWFPEALQIIADQVVWRP
jgi:GT2 family glycosyltransferase